jgi:hypothetical protein
MAVVTMAGEATTGTTLTIAESSAILSASGKGLKMSVVGWKRSASARTLIDHHRVVHSLSDALQGLVPVSRNARERSANEDAEICAFQVD